MTDDDTSAAISTVSVGDLVIFTDADFVDHADLVVRRIDLKAQKLTLSGHFGSYTATGRPIRATRAVPMNRCEIQQRCF